MTYDQRVDGNALVPTKVAAESKFRRQEHWMVIYDPVVRVSIKKKKEKKGLMMMECNVFLEAQKPSSATATTQLYPEWGCVASRRKKPVSCKLA